MCLIFHRWGKWVQYQEHGTAIGGVMSPMRGKSYQYIEYRQKRICEKCGKIQDEIYK